jgi:ribosomal-protein-alanine N-acetyltransferase
MKNPFITGKKIYLRGLTREDLTGPMFQWANDPQVTHFMFMGLRPNSSEQLQKEFEALNTSEKDFVFAIIDKKTDQHIGNAGLYTVNWISRSAEYRIIIGNPKFWNKGIGQEAAKLLIDYGFQKLNLNKVWLGVNRENKAGVQSYKKSGFTEEGILRQEIYRNGKYYDAIRMSFLRQEYHGAKA